MALLQPRIPPPIFRIVALVTFSFSIFVVTCRLVYLVQRKDKRIDLDHIFLIFATIFLIAQTTLLLIMIDSMYFVEEMDLNGIPPNPDTDEIDLFQKLRWSFLAISWTSIFCIKFAYLTLFSGLCARMPKMDLYRKSLYGLSLIALIYLVLNAIVVCLHDESDILQCMTPGALQQNKAMALAGVALDVLTDLTIISIPIILLWKVKLTIYQKLIIGLALCLSIVMIILATTRMIGYGYDGAIDNSWIYLWQHAEACAAVIMFCLTAFRSVFASKALKHNPWNSPILNLGKNRKAASSSTQGLPLNVNEKSTPHSAMTGMRTAWYSYSS